jgi:hypothetical protein
MLVACLLVALSLAATSAAIGEPEAPDTREALRRSVGDLEARAADTRAFVREHANARGTDLEALRSALTNERIPAIERDLEDLRSAVAAVRDDALRSGGAGVDISVQSCWPKWTRWFAADKYLFRASVLTDGAVEVRGMSIREPDNGDLDIVRIPAAAPRADGKAGAQFEIYDSFKIWGSDAEFVVEDAAGVEYVRAFSCD